MSVIFVPGPVSEASVQCARCDTPAPVKQLECAASCYRENGLTSVAYLRATLSGMLLAMLQISPYSIRCFEQ